MKRIWFLFILTALALSACGQATPTADPAQIQASAVAAANTMVALTQAAVPSATPVPPTPLPSPTALPSPTLLALPTLSIDLSATVPAVLPTLDTGGSGNAGGGGNTSGDPCQAPMPAKPAGPQASVRIINSTRASVILSLYLSKNDFGECGYRGFNLESGGGTSTTLPLGCYSAGAFVNDPKKPTKAFGSGCIKNISGATVTVGTEVIKINQ